MVGGTARAVVRLLVLVRVNGGPVVVTCAGRAVRGLSRVRQVHVWRVLRVVRDVFRRNLMVIKLVEERATGCAVRVRMRNGDRAVR